MKTSTSGLIADSDVVKETADYIEKELLDKLNRAGASWKDFTAFWPLRYVKAIKAGEAIIFFGAGLGRQPRPRVRQSGQRSVR